MSRKSADPTKPHWIVVRMSKWDTPMKPHPRKAFFRHGSEQEARAEALRLALKSPGKRFSVYASTSASTKVVALDLKAAAE